MTKPRLHDVARAANVGTTTVSRVLNNHPNISEETRQRVLGAMTALGYQPNPSARALRSGQTRAVSMLLPMLGTAFYETLVSAVYTRLSEQDYDLALFPLLGQLRYRRYHDPGALLYRADALLIASQSPDDLYGGAPPSRLTVLVDALHPQFHSVAFDNHAAGLLAARHALSHHLPVLFLDGEDHPDAAGSPVFAERRRGVLSGLGAQGVQPTQTITAGSSPESSRLAAQALLRQRPAQPFFLLAMSDDLALGVSRHLSEAGLQMGRDYRALGFDGSAAAAKAELSSVAQPAHEMGLAAADTLLAALSGTLHTLTQLVFPPELIEAGSTRMRAAS